MSSIAEEIETVLTRCMYWVGQGYDLALQIEDEYEIGCDCNCGEEIRIALTAMAEEQLIDFNEYLTSLLEAPCYR